MAIDFNADRNRMGLALLAAAGPSVRPMSFGQRMFMGMNQHDDFLAEKEQREQLRKAREAQLAFQQMQMMQMVQEQAQRKAAQEREDAIDGAYRGAIRTPQQQALSQFGGPPGAAAQAMPGMIPQIDQQALIESLAKVDPRTAFQMLAPKPRKLTTVAPGASLVDESDPTTPVFTAPDRQKEADPNQPFMMIDGKMVPNQAYQDYALRNAQASASRLSVGLPPQEKAEQQAVGKYFGDQYADIQRSGLAAGQTINRLGQMKSMLQGMETGKLTPLATDVAGYARSFGINIDPKLEGKEAVNAMSNEMALQMRNPAGGAGMPGALSDKDREFLVNIVPGLSKTPGGNRLIIEAREKLARREQVVAQKAREYRSRKGTLDEGFYEELQRYSDANPLYDGMSNAIGGVDLGAGFRLKGR